MSKKPWFLIVLGIVLGGSTLSFAVNPTEESTLVDLDDKASVGSVTDKNSPSETEVKTNLSESKVQRKSKATSKKRVSQIEVRDNFVKGQRSQGTIRGNLPEYAKQRLEIDREYIDPSVETSKENAFSLYEMKRGTTINAIIEGDIVAYPDSQAPVSAIVTAPEKYKLARLLGTASLDTSTKRINIEFQTLILSDSATSYNIKGITSDRSGKLGLEGIHKTDFWNWLWAEVLVRSSGGIVEASSDKEHSIFGESVSVSPENAARKGVATGLNTVADRFGEKRSNAIEMTELNGPTAITVSIVQ
jgi:hypothetical protein